MNLATESFSNFTLTLIVKKCGVLNYTESSMVTTGWANIMYYNEEALNKLSTLIQKLDVPDETTAQDLCIIM